MDKPKGPSSSAYARAGVDIEAAMQTKNRIKGLVRSTFGPEVIGDMGGFGGLFAPPWKDFDDPVLVSSVDGVGTKLKLAFLSGIHDSIGADIVNHCANDILVQGARPLFFMDYLALGSHDPAVVEAVVGGIARACSHLGCALLGGETAEMGDFYQAGEYDLAGTIVGIVDRSQLLDGSACRAGDALVGLGSDGLHTNGYTLARRVVFEQAGKRPDEIFEPCGRSFVQEMLIPHRPYVQPLLALRQQVELKGLAHITGGGLLDNLPRVLPAGLRAHIDTSAWQVPPLFEFIGQEGQIERQEMFRVFNMGIGMVAVVAAEDAAKAVSFLREAGEQAQIIGRIAAGDGPVQLD